MYTPRLDELATMSDADVRACRVEKWYDRHSRNWVVQTLDKDGNQIADSTYVGNRVDANSAMATHTQELTERMSRTTPTILPSFTLGKRERTRLVYLDEAPPPRRSATAFDVNDVVRANTNAQGLRASETYIVSAVYSRSTPFGNFVTYELLHADGSVLKIGNAHLLLSRVS